MRKYLFRSNIPPKQFACDLEISVSYLYQLLRGERKPSLELAQKIEAYTEGEVTVSKLLGFERQQQDKDASYRKSNDYETRLSSLEETTGKIQDTLKKIEWRISKLEH